MSAYLTVNSRILHLKHQMVNVAQGNYHCSHSESHGNIAIVNP